MKPKRLTIAASVAAALLSSGALAQQDTLGKVTFATSCDPKVQPEIERGVAMLHSYWFIYARRTFENVLKQDPSCAIAYWGVALDLLGNTLVGPPTRTDAQAAADALDRARAIGAKTERERDWIEALGAYFRDHDKVAVDVRLKAYSRAMEELVRRYPDDYEAQVFYALTLQASASPADTTYANQLKSAALLEKLYEQNPQHPGVSHFLIHAYDFAPIAKKGLEAANRYAGIAPAVPHARHMPSHIYSMLGLWEQSIASNASALEIQPDYYHASDFMVYAYLQLAQDANAKAMIEKSLATPDRGDRPITFATFTARQAMPARYVLERGDWAGAAALKFETTKFPHADALIRFTRGLGAARNGDVAAARTEIEALKQLRATLEKANQSYWADRAEDQILAISAWTAVREGAPGQAAKFMRAAADNEDASVKHIAMENRLYPMRELLGDLLFAIGDGTGALEEYETSLATNPNRYRGFAGAAQAAAKAGNQAKAREYFAELVALTSKADTERQEIRQAKAFLDAR